MVDKTGTLTEGKPSVTTIVSAEGFETDELLRIAAGVERAPNTPSALAIVAKPSSPGWRSRRSASSTPPSARASSARSRAGRRCSAAATS